MNRQIFVDKIPNDIRVITAPDVVVIKILETKKFFHHYYEGEYNPHSIFVTWKYRVKILSGELHYPYGIYLKNRNFYFNADSGDVWIGQKWVERRSQERSKRRS